MPTMQDEYELIAVRAKSLLCELEETLKRIADCLCSPPGSQAFNFNGGIGIGCYLSSLNEYPGPGTTILQVPRGMTGTIKKIGIYEKYPGSMYGTTFSLLVNHHAVPELPRLDRNVGGINMPMDVHIELPEQALISVHVGTTFTPFSSLDSGSGYIDVSWPFTISGYFTPVE